MSAASHVARRLRWWLLGWTLAVRTGASLVRLPGVIPWSTVTIWRDVADVLIWLQQNPAVLGPLKEAAELHASWQQSAGPYPTLGQIARVAASLTAGRKALRIFSRRLEHALRRHLLPELCAQQDAKTLEAHLIGLRRAWMARGLERWRESLDRGERGPLTGEQRLAVLSDDEATLVVAAAGSGKGSAPGGRMARTGKKKGHPTGPLGAQGQPGDLKYVGSFDVGGDLIVADRRYIGSSDPRLSHRLPAKRGAWHAWTRMNGEVELLIAVHDKHLALVKRAWRHWDDVPKVGVDVLIDSAWVAMVDSARFDSEPAFHAMVGDGENPDDAEYGMLGASGCTSVTGLGDSTYPLGVETAGGVAVAVQVAFILDGDDDEDDHATQMPSVPVVRKRLDAGVRALQSAVVAGDRTAVERHLAAGINPNSRAKNEQPVLHWAAHLGDARMLQLFGEAGADLFARDRGGETALHIAAGAGRLAAMKMLLAAGADPNDRAAPGWITPLHVAAVCNQHKAAKLLLSAGARTDLRDYVGYTPLMVAASGGQLDVSRVLLAHVTGNDKNEAMLIAAADGPLAMLKLLLRAGADRAYRSKYGKTALMHAQMSKKRAAKAVVRFLKQKEQPPRRRT